MFKVLIVDDEPIVREGLSTLIPWEEYGFEVIGLASNGVEGYSMYEQHEPNLIISDIRMTGMDGLELIRRIRSNNAKIQFLILSGYADFEYAKKAITNDVAGYMLKPIDEDELIEYLESIKKTLRNQVEIEQLEKIEYSKRKEQLIQSIMSLEDDITPDYYEMKELDLLWDQYSLLLIQIEENLDMKCKTRLCRHFENYHDDYKIAVFLNEAYFVILTDYPLENDLHAERIYREIEKVITPYDSRFYVSVSKTVSEFSQLKGAYQEVFTVMKDKFFYNTKTIFSKGNALVQLELQKEVELQGIMDKLYYAIEVGRTELVDDLLKEIVYCEQENLCEKRVKKRFVKVLTGITNKLTYSNPEIQSEIIQISEQTIEVYQQTNIVDMLKFVNSLCNQLISVISNGDTDTQLKKLIDLIDRRYNENLKLETLAEVFNYNSAYLGKIFKSYTGEYFNTYLDKVRIKNGKKMLLEGYKVYQVAEAIGYSNVDYFHSKFKKYEGVSPSAYKRKLMQ